MAYDNPNVKKQNFYFMKLKKNISKAGKAYYTGKFAYAIDLVGFEKEDGTITLWMVPQDMDKLKQQQGQQYQKPASQAPSVQQRAYQPQAPPYVDHTRQGNSGPAYPDDPGPGDDDIPF